MIKGQSISVTYVKSSVENKNFTKSRMEAYRKFCTNYVEISPIPNSVFIGEESSKSIFVKTPSVRYA